MLDGSDVLTLAFSVLFVGPIAAMFLAFQGTRGLRKAARLYLLLTWLALGAATLWGLWTAFFKPSTGIGNGVFLIIAIPLGIWTGICFSVWRSANRQESLRSLPPDLRRQEELVDIESALVSAHSTLASAEAKLGSSWTPARDRRQLQAQVAAAKSTIRQLEKARAERQ